jgi:hypothetical protein
MDSWKIILRQATAVVVDEENEIELLSDWEISNSDYIDKQYILSTFNDLKSIGFNLPELILFSGVTPLFGRKIIFQESICFPLSFFSFAYILNFISQFTILA